MNNTKSECNHKFDDDTFNIEFVDIGITAVENKIFCRDCGADITDEVGCELGI